MSLADKFELSLHKGSFPEGFRVIRSALTAYNEAALGVERKEAFMAASVKGKIVGGISYFWYGESAILDYVVVEEKWRRSNIGQKLIEAVENELVGQGCRKVHVATLDFQAPAFYLKQGYELVARVPLYIEKNDFLFFIKHLQQRHDQTESHKNTPADTER